MTGAQKLNRALVRVECFKLLEGWGNTTEKGGREEFAVWRLDERKRKAADLADWALGDAP